LGKAGDLDGLLASVQPYAVDVDWRILSKALIDRCHAAGIKVFSDALGENEQIGEYSKAMDWGIDLIQTDHPLRVMRAIELREDRKLQPPEPLRP
jgi:glycerophosphoryl diester phosphodiesterase